MVAVFVRDHVLLGEWSTAGTEFIDQLLEEGGVEVRGLVHRAVERPYRRVSRTAAGAHLFAEQPDFGTGVTRHQLMPHRVHGIAGSDHAALRELVGVCAGL